MDVRGVWKEAEKKIILRGDKMNIIESCVDRHALSDPSRLAFVFEDGKRVEYTYKKLLEEVNKFANLLIGNGVKKGQHVFCFLPKVPEMYIAILGAIKAGCVAAPLFEAFQQDGLEMRLERGDAVVLVTNKELSARVPSNIKKKVPSFKKMFVVDSDEYKKEFNSCSNKFDAVLVDKKDTGLMIFTSSTAGTPVAGIMIPHYGLVQQHYTAELVLDLKKNDNYWCTAHPGWVTGAVYGIVAPLSIGCTNYVLEGRFEAPHWIDFLKKNKINVVYTAPTALRMLRGTIKKEDLKGVRNICSVGEALTETVFNDYKKLGVEINDTFWQTETGAMIIAGWPGIKKKVGALGKAIPGVNADIVDGVIVMKPEFPPALMTSVYKHEQMYKDYFKDGFFVTNDLAKKDKDGYIFFEARRDDIIKTAGERVSPIEVESALMKHPAVKEAAIIGIPDPIRGAILKAFIVLNKNFVGKENDKLKEEIGTSVKTHYAGHAYPKEIQFVSSLPKTNSGKIIRMQLREMENKKA
jgi:acetyl-CoA synthetase